MTELRLNNKTEIVFSQCYKNIRIETLMEEVRPTDVEDCEFEYRDLSKLRAFTAYFALSAFRQKEQNRSFPFE